MGCSKCEVCCRNCCYSTPLFTLIMVCFTGTSLLGFTLAGVYALANLSPLPQVGNNTAVVTAPVVCGIMLVTLLPLILLTLMSYFITGYIRDIFFHNKIKACIGSSHFNVIFLIALLVYITLWVLLDVGLGGVMAYYLQLDLFCGQRTPDGAGMMTGMATAAGCFYYVTSEFGFLSICEESDLDVLCREGLSVGLAFSIALLFGILVTLGMIVLTVIHAYNYVSARDHIDYRESARTEYDMKRVR